MAMATIATWYLPPDDPLLPRLRFPGDPGLAMLIAVLLALFFLGKNPLAGKGGRLPVSELLDKSGTALGAASSLLLIIAAGGAFKQVLIDSGIGEDLVALLKDVSVSPLLLGWGVATMLRIAVGSATVAGMTAAGIALPLVAGGQASPELMTLAIGAGSLMCSHVNDTGFWMFKEWFGLSLRDTFRSWTAMETIVGLAGLAGVMLLDLFMS
jgi:H+/gluconate symporter-like permease